MDINTRINWQPGMEISAQTFVGLDFNQDIREAMTLRTALIGKPLGIIPDTEFLCRCSFYKQTCEIDPLIVTAHLVEGKILSIHEPVSLPIPVLYGHQYYLTATFSDEYVEFERETVPMIRPRYSYAIETLEELEQGGRMPLVRFAVDNGAISVDEDFIPPVLLIRSDPRIEAYNDIYKEYFTKMGQSPNVEGNAKFYLNYIAYRLTHKDPEITTKDYLRLIVEGAHVVYKMIFQRYKPEMEAVIKLHLPDIQLWMEWFKGYLEEAATVLDGVVLEKKEIDYTDLCNRIKRELTEELTPLFTQQIRVQVDQAKAEALANARQVLQDYAANTLRPELHDELHGDLHDQLATELDPSLYQKLYAALFAALYREPEAEEDNFMPLI